MQNGTPKISGYRLIKTLRSAMLEVSHFQSVNGSGQNSPFPLLTIMTSQAGILRIQPFW